MSKLETGTVSLSSTVDGGVTASVTFDSSYNSPVVVTYIPTRGGGQSIQCRAKNVTSTGCDIHMEEPDDEAHATETVVYVVCEEGVHETDGYTVEAGIHTTNTVRWSGGGSFDSVKLTAGWSVAPVIIHNLQTYNNGQFIATAAQNVTASSFDFAQEAAETGHESNVVNEDLAYIAISPEPNGGTLDGVTFETNSRSDGANDGVDNNPHTISFSASFSNTPDIAVSQQTMNGADGAWARGAGTQWNTSGHETYAEEDQSADTERGHTDETFGYFAIEPNANVTFTVTVSDSGSVTNSSGSSIVGTITSFADDVGSTISSIADSLQASSTAIVSEAGSYTEATTITTISTSPEFQLISDGDSSTAANGLTSDTTSDGGRLGVDTLQASDTAIIQDGGQTVDSIATPTTAQSYISADDSGSVVASVATILDQDDFAYTDVPGSLTASTSTTESGGEDGIGEESPAPTASSTTTFQSGTFSLGSESPAPETAIASPTTTSDTGTADEAGSTEPATASPTTTSDTGTADDADHYMYFRGAGTGDGFDVPHDASIDFTDTDFTIALRCSVPYDLSINSNNNWRGVLGKGGAFTAYDVLFEDQGTVSFSTHHADGTSNRNFAGDIPMDGTPFTVVCTHDQSAGENANWVDGSRAGTSTGSTDRVSSTTGNLQGANFGSNDLVSIVEEIRVDARKWSQTEIESYAAGGEPDRSDTRVLLGFDAGGGSAIYDYSTYGNDATIDNSPEWVPGAKRSVAHPTTTSDTGTADEAGSLTDALSAALSASTFGLAQDTAEIETALTSALSASESALTIVGGSTTGSFASALSGSDFAYTDVPGSLSSGSFSVFSGDEYGIGDESPAPTQGAVSTFSADEFGLADDTPAVVDALATVLSAAEYGVADESGAVEAAFVTTESGQEFGIGDETPTPTATQATPIASTEFSFADDSSALQSSVGEAVQTDTFGFADESGSSQDASGVALQADTFVSADDASSIQDAVASTMEAAETGDTFVRGEIQNVEVTTIEASTFGLADDQSEETEAVVVTLSGVEYDMTGVIRTTDDGVTQS